MVQKCKILYPPYVLRSIRICRLCIIFSYKSQNLVLTNYVLQKSVPANNYCFPKVDFWCMSVINCLLYFKQNARHIIRFSVNESTSVQNPLHIASSESPYCFPLPFTATAWSDSASLLSNIWMMQCVEGVTPGFTLFTPLHVRKYPPINRLLPHQHLQYYQPLVFGGYRVKWPNGLWPCDFMDKWEGLLQISC